MNLLRTIIFSLVNKNYFFYLVILFVCYVFPLASKGFVFPLLRWIILDFELERIFKKIPKIFQSILCRMDKWNLFLSTIILLFDVLTILMQHFVLLFSILIKKRNFRSKGNNSQSSCMMDIYFKRLIIYQSGITINMSNT